MTTDPARPFAMEAWPAGTRHRALRHALRYRAKARQEWHYGEKWRKQWLYATHKAARLEDRIAALEAALRRALAEDSAGLRDWRRGLEEVLRHE